MTDPTTPAEPTSPTPRPSKRNSAGLPAARTPRWGFFKGFLTGAVIEIPAIALGVWVLARFGAGDPQVAFMRVLRLTTIFAGIAAVLTAAGLGRLAAHASVAGGRRRAAWVTGRAHAVASIALVIIAAIPHGHIPGRGPIWLLYPLVGIAIGFACGALIGVVCGGAAPVGIADVWSIARLPGGMIKNILAPEDLARLGAALRDRTTHLFEGMFDPAPKAPDEKPPDPKHPPKPDEKPKA